MSSIFTPKLKSRAYRCLLQKGGDQPIPIKSQGPANRQPLLKIGVLSRY
ncbi:hypothetical protein A359_06380 [secondary endosymbiont of Ctenarytaina eucalypti]|uniref:Uncharacterized protein n=1 Tax=secondary endosymbiont of Ctenarytaina eucalypti TaxID=1199245 RepID=J3Z428_9ENTR|nr:hypothetical protein A359_06380 [secondary endosymbiont of Ctenarytaina eucalypti]